MANKRYWFVNGQKIYVSNSLHNFLRDSKDRMIEKDNIEAEHHMFSLDDEISESKLEEMDAVTPAFDDQLLMQIILEAAIQNISKHSQEIIRIVYYQHVSVSECARRLGINTKRMQRDVQKALSEIRKVLENFGITRMGDLM